MAAAQSRDLARQLSPRFESGCKSGSNERDRRSRRTYEDDRFALELVRALADVDVQCRVCRRQATRIDEHELVDDGGRAVEKTLDLGGALCDGVVVRRR